MMENIDFHTGDAVVPICVPVCVTVAVSQAVLKKLMFVAIPEGVCLKT